MNRIYDCTAWRRDLLVHIIALSRPLFPPSSCLQSDDEKKAQTSRKLTCFIIIIISSSSSSSSIDFPSDIISESSTWG